MPLGRPSQLPFVGAALSLRRDPLGFLRRNAREARDLVQFTVFGRRAWQVNHPAFVREVLRQSHAVGDRPSATPAFSPRAWCSWANVIVEATDDWLDAWPNGVCEDARAALDLARRIDLRLVVGTDRARVSGAVRDLGTLAEVAARPRLAWHRPIFGHARAPAGPSRLVTETGFDSGLNAIASLRVRNGIDRHDALAVMLARRVDGAVSTDAVGRGIANAIHFVMQHRSAWGRVVAEVDARLGEHRPRASDMVHLPEVRRFVHEVYRRRPSVSFASHELVAPLLLGGHALAAGHRVYVPIEPLHHDARWFPEPESFLPDRWRNELERRLPRCAYLPFGTRAHGLVAEQTALVQLQLVLARVAQRPNT